MFFFNENLQGLSAGSWIRFGGPSQLGTPTVRRPVILFTGAGGKFGMAINHTADELAAWVQIRSTSTTERSWWCRASGLGLRQNTANMQWMHYGLVWGPLPDSDEVVLRILLNGRERAQCSSDDHNTVKPEFVWVQDAALRAAKLYNETETNRESFILLSVGGLEPVDATMSVALMALTPTVLTGSSVIKLLGLDYTQYLTFHISTFYWPISGFFRKLTPGRITPLRVTSVYNSQDVYAGAMCTDGTNQSYIALSGDLMNKNGQTNLGDACIINPTKCYSYVFIMECKQPKLLSSETLPNLDVEMELFRTAPINAPLNTVGLTIAISSNGQRLLVTARSEFRTLSNSVPLTAVNMSNKWIKLEIIYKEKLLVIRNAGVILASSINGSMKMEQNQPLSSIEAANLNVFVGRGYPICVSEVATIDVPVGEDPESLINSGTAIYCYPESDFLLELKGMQTDHVGLPKSARSLQELISPFRLSQSPCLYNPNNCEQGSFTLSFWIRVDMFTDSTGMEIKPNTFWESSSISCTRPRSTKQKLLGLCSPDESVPDKAVCTVLRDCMQADGAVCLDPTLLSAVLLSTGPPANRGLLIKIIQRMAEGKVFLDLQVEVQTSTDLWLINSPNALQLGQWTNLGVNWQAALEMKSGSLEIYSNGIRQRSSTLPQSSVTVPVNISTEPGLYFNAAFLTKASSMEQTEQHFINGAVNHLYIAHTIDLSQKDADTVKDFLEAVLTIMQQWPVALDSACDITPSEYCTTLSTEQDSIVTLLLRLNALISKSGFEIAWDELLQMGKAQPTVITNIVSSVMFATGNTLETLSDCQQAHRMSTDVGFAMSVAVNMKSHCAGSVVTVTSQSLLNNVTLGQATFNLSSPVFEEPNKQAATGLVTDRGGQ
ncbi:hypothetical protein AHF37_11585, partial [Paragonimus kellicotti]